MSDGPRELEYRSDRLVNGRLLTRQVNPREKDVPAKYRPWVGPVVAVELLPQYRRFQCKRCGRVDEAKCFRRGLPKDFAVPAPRPDLHVTDEYIKLWSSRLADRVCDVAAKHVELFELPGDRGYVVPWPRRLFTVPKGSKIYRESQKIPKGVAFRPYSKPCPACGRYRSTTFWSQEFTVPADVVLAATAIDTDDYPGMFRSLSWIVSADLAQHLRPMKFTNVKLSASFANS
jgi:hypothetical protein